MDPSWSSDASRDNNSELKTQELVVGASRFELETSCAQGRRATRLRYAPTSKALLILKHFPTSLQSKRLLKTLGICVATRLR